MIIVRIVFFVSLLLSIMWAASPPEPQSDVAKFTFASVALVTGAIWAALSEIRARLPKP